MQQIRAELLAEGGAGALPASSFTSYGNLSRKPLRNPQGFLGTQFANSLFQFLSLLGREPEPQRANLYKAWLAGLPHVL